MTLEKINKYITVNKMRFWFVILLVSVMGMLDIPASSVLGCSLVLRWIVIISIAAFKATVLTLLLAISACKKILSLIVKTIVTVYLVICAFNGIIYSLYGMGISVKIFSVIGQTNLNEIQEFIPTIPESMAWFLVKPSVIVVVGILITLVLICNKLRRTEFAWGVLSLSAVGFITLVAVTFSLHEGRAAFYPSLRLGRVIYRTYKENNLMAQDLKKISDLPAPFTVKSSRDADIVMVVGESASRENLSLYGFPLSTSPILDSISDDLIVFDDVIGTSTLTIINMRRILTFLTDREDTEKWYKSPMLMALMNKAGYSTVWLSNQEKRGMWGNSTAIMVSMADDIRYLSGIDNTDALLQNYDDILLPELCEILQENKGPQFIGLHLMGSHQQYWRRYPAEFDFFNSDSVRLLQNYHDLTASQATIVAEYFNSLRYTDFIISQIIAMVETRERPSVMIYLSDHGENVHDEGGNYIGRDRKHVQVPFVIYLNGKFKEQYPELAERLKAVRHCPMTTAEIPHLICTLTGTKYQLYADSMDVTSPAFIQRRRYVDGEPWEFDKIKTDEQ